MPLDGPPLSISARPRIEIDGQDLPLLSAAIVRLSVREQPGGLSSLELALSDVLGQPDGSAGFGATAGAPLRPGAAVTVMLGATETPQHLFRGTVTAIEAEAGPHTSPIFTLLAEDALWKARKVRRSRLYEQSSPADIARGIAQDAGLRPEIREGLDQPVADWMQANESDLAFLRRVLDRFDADLAVTDDRLQVGRRADEPRARLDLRLGEGLVRVRATADLADQVGEVRVAGFDPASGEAVQETASSGPMGPGEGSTGAQLLRPLLDPARAHEGHHGPITSAEARLLAEAGYGRRARRFVRLDATAQGNSDLRVGTHVTIAGVNPFFANTYVVTEATHRFDLERGYLTDFLAECAYLGRGP